jgi:hypothetical protein
VTIWEARTIRDLRSRFKVKNFLSLMCAGFTPLNPRFSGARFSRDLTGLTDFLGLLK